MSSVVTGLRDYWRKNYQKSSPCYILQWNHNNLFDTDFKQFLLARTNGKMHFVFSLLGSKFQSKLMPLIKSICGSQESCENVRNIFSSRFENSHCRTCFNRFLCFFISVQLKASPVAVWTNSRQELIYFSMVNISGLHHLFSHQDVVWIFHISHLIYKFVFFSSCHGRILGIN